MAVRILQVEAAVRVRARLRAIRQAQGLSLRDVVDRTGIAVGVLSMMERGHQLPRDDEARRMVGVYGDPEGWYPATVRRSLADEPRACGRCGAELPMDARANRRYHDRCPEPGGPAHDAELEEFAARLPTRYREAFDARPNTRYRGPFPGA